MRKELQASFIVVYCFLCSVEFEMSNCLLFQLQSLQSELQFRDAEMNEMRTKILNCERIKPVTPVSYTRYKIKLNLFQGVQLLKNFLTSPLQLKIMNFRTVLLQAREQTLQLNTQNTLNLFLVFECIDCSSYAWKIHM